jgi:hypothetical protein
MLAFGVVAAIVTIAAPLVLDADPVFRFPYLASLTRAYSCDSGPSVIALGSSRTCGSVDVTLMTQILQERLPYRNLTAFNAAVPAGGPVTQEIVLDGLLETGRRPDLVLVEVAPEMVDHPNAWFHLSRDTTWSNLSDVWTDAVRVKGGARLFESRFLPIFALRSGIRSAIWGWAHRRLGRTAPRLDPSDWIVPTVQAARPPGRPVNPPTLTEEMRQAQSKVNPTLLSSFRPIGSGARALRRILARCKEEGISVLLVEAPACTMFRAAREPARAKYETFLRHLLDQHPEARYANFVDIVPDTAFFDPHHVNEFGRDLISRHLSQVAIVEAYASWQRERSMNLELSSQRRSNSDRR